MTDPQRQPVGPSQNPIDYRTRPVQPTMRLKIIGVVGLTLLLMAALFMLVLTLCVGLAG